MELKGYRENLEMIREHFPDRVSIDPQECADLMGVDRKMVYAAIHRRKNPLPHNRLGTKTIRIPVAQLARWMCITI